MQQILLKKLHEYIRKNNPELLIQLEKESKVTEYLQKKCSTVNKLLQKYDQHPEYITEDICMDMLTKDLRPSKFNYILNILEEEFENRYQKFTDFGTLHFEIIKLVNHCLPVFNVILFTEENEDSMDLRYVIMYKMREYYAVQPPQKS